MTRKQTLAIALMCVAAALLAALMLWRQPAGTDAHGHGEQQEHANDEHANDGKHEEHGEHKEHEDSHGHDDRHADTAPPAAPSDAIAMSEAQIKANGIAIDAAQPAAIRERLHLPAQVRADAERTVAIAAPARGMVQSVPVSPGSVVRKGDALVTLQSPEVAQWRAEAAAAAQRLQLARTVAERERKLWDERISARQDLDIAQAALGEAQVQADAARQRLAALGIAASGGASVTLRAPLSGVVIDRPAVAGMASDGTQPLLTIADLDRVWIEAAVPSGSLAQVEPGMPATVTAAALAEAVQGTVSFVGPVLGEATRMATARVTLANPGMRLRPGMLATVDLLGPKGDATVTVAADAVQTIHERSVVFVRTPGGFEARTVTLGRSDGRRTEIVKGLAAGTRYAAAGSYLLKADLGKAEAEHDH
ncbi:efflux RND transporter periplasmic adaptor subunit [Pseudoduganella sp. SL102]|uniref:efflux RND transporter periplasmic adaptor subunit n=1 Tax=Pseudoduganella sp. SL102 TaxID=2995154 RepID=UPI00248B7FC1|nr:efflux RND transporter periplasmic adaptor subunit [Pseudoduganella sp. SL102]WBS03045.1 efflux RND transporter periplasmic adaptor subunit [Pseudoduganella sp. SL102]